MISLFSKKSQTIALLSVVWLIITLLSEITFYFVDESLMMCPILIIHLLWVLSVSFMLNENISADHRRANLIAAIAPNVMFVLLMLSVLIIDRVSFIIPRQEFHYANLNQHFYRTTAFGKVCNLIEYGTVGLFLLSYVTSIVVWLFNTYIVIRAHKLINIKNIFNLDKY